MKEDAGSVTGSILVSTFAALFLQPLQRERFAQGTVGGRNPAPLYLHPKTNPRTPSLTLGNVWLSEKKKLNDQNPAPPQWQKTPNIELGGKGDALICPNYPSKCWCRILSNRLGKAFLFVFGPQAIFTSNTLTHFTRPCFMRLRKGMRMIGKVCCVSGVWYMVPQVYGLW